MNDVVNKADAWDAAVAMPRKHQWKPIESCPKDGSSFLASFSKEKSTIDIMILCVLHFEGDPDGPGFYDACRDDGQELIVWPTHWMPLPSPPHNG